MTRNEWPLEQDCPDYPHTHDGAICPAVPIPTGPHW